VPKPLENCFASVVRLDPREVAGEERIASRHYDSRMARRFTIRGAG
jgi:hypothetical protein